MNKAIEDAFAFWLLDELRGKLFDTTERIPDKNAMDVNMDKAEVASLVERKNKIQDLLDNLPSP